ncbi:MAG: hypothetical protein K1X83_05730 [Oligoflexia bacterium]|nr:hypothetical protein [Oligoflexia bacterium]
MQQFSNAPPLEPRADALEDLKVPARTGVFISAEEPEVRAESEDLLLTATPAEVPPIARNTSRFEAWLSNFVQGFLAAVKRIADYYRVLWAPTTPEEISFTVMRGDRLPNRYQAECQLCADQTEPDEDDYWELLDSQDEEYEEDFETETDEEIDSEDEETDEFDDDDLDDFEDEDDELDLSSEEEEDEMFFEEEELDDDDDEWP